VKLKTTRKILIPVLILMKERMTRLVPFQLVLVLLVLQLPILVRRRQKRNKKMCLFWIAVEPIQVKLLVLRKIIQEIQHLKMLQNLRIAIPLLSQL